MKIYLVGGAVRDQLLGLAVEEQDWVVVGSTPEEMTRLGYKPVGKDFPVFLHPQTHAEYALARTERKTAKGYKGFQVYAAPEVTLEEDLQRRDLTINAIAQTTDGKMIDPYGGQRDLQDRVLRHVSPAFIEDPVRILRLARFAARFPDFQIHPDTLCLMQVMVEQGEVDALVPERVWQEWYKALQTQKPARFLEVLINVGAFAILFPGWVTYETGLVAMSRAELPIVRFAVLFYATPIKVSKKLLHRYRVPKEYEEFTQLVGSAYPQYKNLNTTDVSSVLALLEHMDVFRRPERLELFLLACEAIDNEPASAKAALLHAAYRAAKSVAAQSLIEPGMKGEDIKKAVRRQREKAIEQVLLKKIKTDLIRG